MLFKGLYKAPAGILINDRILEELFTNDLTVFQTGKRNKFYIHLDPLTGMIHLFVRLWDILGIGRVNCHNALLFQEAEEAGNGTGIAALSELDPKDHQAGVRIASA